MDTPFLNTDERYYKMIDEVEDYAILLLNREGKIQNWNRGAEKIKGYSEKEILGKSFSIFYLPKDRVAKLPQHLLALAAEKGKAMHEGWRMRKDGSAFWGHVVITALHDHNNTVIGFTKVTRDLTERKLAEDQRDQDAKSIAIQNRQLEEFAYITSHDLQEPARKIQTFTRLLEKNIDNKEELLKYLGKINSSADRIVTLIKDVLNFSRLTLSQELFESVDLNATLEDVLVDFELAIREKDAQIITGQLPVVHGIPVQFHQLLSNLISNALKFNAGSPYITIRSEIAEETISGLSALYHQISIQDNGIGFEAQYSEQAFLPFRRLTTEYAGTGIGLALCRRIVENHRGSLRVTSHPGKGTTFTVSLPLE